MADPYTAPTHWQDRFNALVTYNTECVQFGIVHTPEVDAEMALLQAEYDAWLEEWHAWNG